MQYSMLADRLRIPLQTKALLWDMDGVLIDSLGLDLIVINTLLQKYFQLDISLPRRYIRSIFAYDIPTFWKKILEKIEQEYGIKNTTKYFQEIGQEYTEIRQNTAFMINPGIREILKAAAEKNIGQAVVSNNPHHDIEEILKRADILDFFTVIVGNDHTDIQKKPAPDPYLFACKKIHISPEYCVVVEDSVLGVAAGKQAGCYTIGVCTGSADEKDFAAGTYQPDTVVSSFALPL